jgi:hypothetical protein
METIWDLTAHDPFVVEEAVVANHPLMSFAGIQAKP